MKRSIDVQHLGAFGDGERDDTAVLHSAVELAGEGGAIHLPPGRYKFDETLEIGSRELTLSGVGMGSELFYTGTGPAVRIKDVDFVSLRNLQIVGNGSDYGVGADDESGLVIEHSNLWRLDQVRICRHGSHGVELKGGVWRGVISGSWIHYNGGDGLHSMPADAADFNGNSLAISGTSFCWNEGHGLHWCATGLAATGCLFELNHGAGVCIDASHDQMTAFAALIHGNYFENSRAAQILLALGQWYALSGVQIGANVLCGQDSAAGLVVATGGNDTLKGLDLEISNIWGKGVSVAALADLGNTCDLTCRVDVRSKSQASGFVNLGHAMVIGADQV